MSNDGTEIFDTTRSAVVFAFNFSTEQYGQMPLARLQRSSIGSGKGLVGTDGAGQAGMVLAQVWRLNLTERAAIVARFSPRSESCPCCGGQKPTALWQEAVEQLASVALPVGVSHYRCRIELVAKHFGLSVRFEDLATRHGLSRNTISEHYRSMTRRLADIEAQAQASIDDALRVSGMVWTA
jgi:hypothetical protein